MIGAVYLDSSSSSSTKCSFWSRSKVVVQTPGTRKPRNTGVMGLWKKKPCLYARNKPNKLWTKNKVLVFCSVPRETYAENMLILVWEAKKININANLLEVLPLKFNVWAPLEQQVHGEWSTFWATFWGICGLVTELQEERLRQGLWDYGKKNPLVEDYWRKPQVESINYWFL